MGNSRKRVKGQGGGGGLRAKISEIGPQASSLSILDLLPQEFHSSLAVVQRLCWIDQLTQVEVCVF